MAEVDSPRPRRLVIVGAVAAGTSVGAKARRNDEAMEVVVYERDEDISYSGCGLPYLIGGQVQDSAELTPRDPAWFADRYRIDIRTRHEVLAVDREARTLQVRNLATGEESTDSYDTLVLATGARSVVPAVPGTDLAGVFTLRNVRDGVAIRRWLDGRRPRSAVVVGSGFIGLEVTEQLAERGLAVTLVERLPQVLPALDADMAFRVEEALTGHGVSVRVGAGVTAITGTDAAASVTLDSGEQLDADLVVLAVGVRANVELAAQLGADLGPSGAIRVDASMRTSVPDVFAVGDCAESFSVITGASLWRPLGSTANKMGRIAGDVISGGTLAHRGILGTGILRVFELAVAYTGLTEDEARAQGFDVVVLHNLKPSHASYLGGRQIVVKAVADRASGRLLGAQAIGAEGVDKRIDVLATAITFGATAADLFHLDLAYSPPFATTKDPVHYTGMALDNAIHGRAPLITPSGLDERLGAGERLQVVDVRSAKDHAKSHVPGSVHIPLKQLRARIGELDPALPTVTYCNSGVSGNAGQNVLLARGFADVSNLSGGNNNYQTHLRQLAARRSARASVLFVCVHNAGKSQMAAALMRLVAGDRVDVHSAGTHPDAEVHDLSAAAVAELGADMSREVPKPLDPALLAAVDRVVVLGDEARLEPVPGMRAPVMRWLIDDPAERGIEGLERVRLMRDDIAARVRSLAAELAAARP